MAKLKENKPEPPVLDRSNSGAQFRLLSFVERIERLEEERGGIGDDIKEVIAEAKGEGWDTPTIRKVIQRRRKDKGDIQEADALLETYEDAIARAEEAKRTESVEEGE